MNKKICFLLSEHPFLDARIFKKEAKSLLKQGYRVTMIVPRKDGYLFDVDGTIFYDNYRSTEFIHEGINIITYEQIYPEKEIKKLHHNLRSGNFTRFSDPLTQLGIAQKADFYHAHEFYSLYSGIGIKRALSSKGKHCKLIYDSHELEPDPLVHQPQRTKNIKQQMLAYMLKELDYVITVSESIKSWYLDLDPQLPIEVIHNSPPLAFEYESIQLNKQELLIAYEGVMNHKRGNFNKLMNILDICDKKFDLKVKIIGGSKKDHSLFIPPHLENKVYFTGWVSYDLIPEAMKDVDLGWVDLDAVHSLNNRFAMPNKFFSYLNNGVPVLVNQCTEMERFIQTYKCGYVVNRLQATAEDYFQALLFLHSNRSKIHEMSVNARDVMETQFSWEHMEKRLFAIYDRLGKDMGNA
ncbi:glycosyltransferase involved in cell wall biosynthesis [Virgibacillus natechei]|uniref:Glycosyltransferase involved in cell wall biosynthesis n=1 Tax=Virgibacillus natechei TaxID=1216297 RepID=A0ABS4ICT4_9BACI|nr:glycosyltransferase [Virgibacillus natechei]MBP1968450.1 glycosyltransferase involved in cell wall biosynthesis [Virgibacillus natechei]UZD13571.1 glycosyltransferase [Virgibacillus natechei]